MKSALPVLEEAAAQYLVQREPYPIVAAPNTQVIARTVEAAQRTNQKVMVIGSGSSFGPDFTLIRDDLIAILMSAMTAVGEQGDSSSSVAVGVKVSDLIAGEIEYQGSTLGGLLARDAKGLDRVYQHAIWQKVALVEVIDGAGKQRVLSGPAKASAFSSAGADFLIGSCGRLGIITGVQFIQPYPFQLTIPEDGSTLLQLSSAGKAPFVHDELSATLDPFSVFKW